jgi:hypothetical protein
MHSGYFFKRLIYLFGFCLAFVANAAPDSATQAEIETIDVPSESSGHFQWVKYGTWSYLSVKPPSVDDHLARIDDHLGRDIYWLFEYGWRARMGQEHLRQLSPLDDEYATLKKEITDNFQELKRLFNGYYDHARRNMIEYVDPDQMPKKLAWRLGVLLALYGNFQKEMALCDLDSSLEQAVDQEIAENVKVLDFYKTSLLLFSYYFGLSNRSPPILQHVDLDAFVSHPEFSSELDLFFQNEFSFVDETAWIQALQKLDQQRLEHICGLFRSFYRLFLQSREVLPNSYASLAAHLNNIITKILLSAQKKADYNLDAINPWMFRLYIDLKNWGVLQMQDETLETPDLQRLLPKVQSQCLRLLPPAFALEDITEENEYAVCEEVRMRNLLPTHQGDLDRGEEIVDEFEFSPLIMRRAFIDLLNFFDDRADFVRGYHLAVKECNEKTQQIYNYLSGYVEMSEIPITKENALDYLLKIKLFDILADVWNSHTHVDYEYFGGIHFGYIGFGQFYFQRTTYELRKKILKLCPTIHSYEALTLSVNPHKVQDEKEQTTPDGWVDESETLRQMCIADLLKSAQNLSDVMNQSPLKGIIVGTRGISGVGKSTFLKRNILPLILPEGQKEPWQIEALAKGILNPDTIKASLRKLQGDTLNTQVHHEGSNAFQRMFKEIAIKGSYILDKRHLIPYEIMTNLVEPAKNKGDSVWLFDFDISLTAGISRILARPLHGEDSCPEYEALIEGFLAVRRYRAQVVALAIKEDAIAKYELYATSKQNLIAHKISEELCPFNSDASSSLCIHDPHLFDECLREPTDQEIEKELSQIINDSFINEAIARGDIAPEQRQSLEKWRGMTLKESIQRHIQGGKGASDESLFEPVVVSPFNGAEWLADLPQLITHLQSEHCLHIRGVDEAGRGLHWEAGQFEKGLNSKFNPDAKAPGFNKSGIQMKLGYFIVPADNLEIHLSENLSPEVARELAVRNEKGELIGFRFFVHPQAYAHFAPLFRANISFVSPSQSEFMGTATSSYNSWLIRHVSTCDRKPFIVKMGTPNGLGDIKHLFTGDDIVKSLSLQKQLDQLPERVNFVLFKETVGLILKNIPGYPAGTIDSGLVICELPEQFLAGDCKILSFSALMSCERIKPKNQGVGGLDPNHAEIDKLPLIYELMEVAIQKGLAKTPEDFLQIYFIDAYLQAIEPIVFKEGYSLADQGQNLYLVLNLDNTIKGFAYRDLETMIFRKNFLESYSWFYRYTNFVKLLNVLTQSESDDVPPPYGGPICAGIEKPMPERNLCRYLCTMLDKEGDYPSLEVLKRLSITPEESLKLLKQLDASYLMLLKRYFAIDESIILNSDGTVLCAEKGSIAEKALAQKNQVLWESRISAEEAKQSN